MAWHIHFEGNCIQLEFWSFNIGDFLIISDWCHLWVDVGACVHFVGFSLDGKWASTWFDTFHLFLIICRLIVFGQGVADLDLAKVLIRLVFVSGLEICGLISWAFFVNFTGCSSLSKDFRLNFTNLWLLEISYLFWFTVAICGLWRTHLFWGFHILSWLRILAVAFGAFNFIAWLLSHLFSILLSLLLFKHCLNCGLGSLLLVNALLSLWHPWLSFHIHLGWILGLIKMASIDWCIIQSKVSWCWVGCGHPYLAGITWGFVGHEWCS